MMRAAKLESTQHGYAIMYLGELVRNVSPFDWDYFRALHQVECINEQFKRHIARLSRIHAANESLGLCGKLTKSRPRLTLKTIIASNKARGLK